MANHLEELGRTLYEQRGSLTAEICKKAVEEAAAKIEKDAAIRGVAGLISDLRTYLMRNSSDVEACLAEIRRVLLRSGEIMRQRGDAKIIPKANGPQANSVSGSVQSGGAT